MKKRKLIEAIKRRPRRALSIMLIIVTLNFGAMLYFSRTAPAATVLHALQSARDTAGRQIAPPGTPFSIENYVSLSRLRDSLAYLMGKKTMTAQDTLLFLRLAAQYEKIDPGFFRSLQKQNTK